MLQRAISFVLAGLVIVAPMWVLFYGDDSRITARIIMALAICSVVGVAWIYDDLRALLRVSTARETPRRLPK
jgi:hypothetical protein